MAADDRTMAGHDRTKVISSSYFRYLLPSIFFPSLPRRDMGDATQPQQPHLHHTNNNGNLNDDLLPLTSWLITHTDILPSKASEYAALFVRNNIGNAVRLAKNVLKRPDFLSKPPLPLPSSFPSLSFM